MQTRKFLALAAITTAVGMMAYGAPPETSKQKAAGNPANKTDEQRASWKSGDHMLASCVAIDNQEEVAIARWAESRLKNDDAKKFAQMLIKDHTAFLKKLQQFAPEATEDGFLSPERTASGSEGDRTSRKERSGQETARTDKTERTAAKPNLEFGGPMIDQMQLHRELAEQCLADTQHMLSEKNDREFDACFIGLQIAKHAGMKTKLEVFQRHASGELKELLAQGQKTTTAHLEHAEKIMKQIDDDDR